MPFYLKGLQLPSILNFLPVSGLLLVRTKAVYPLLVFGILPEGMVMCAQACWKSHFQTFRLLTKASKHVEQQC